MAADDGLRAVVDDRHRHPTEVGERAAVAVEERLEVLAGGEAAERVARVRQRHVERVDLRDAHVGEDLALVAPVDLGLGAGDDLEAAVHASEFRRRDAEFLGDARPGLLNVELDPLVVAGEPVLRGQPLVDHRSLHQDFCPEHRVHQRRELVDHPRLRPPVRRPARRGCRTWCRQILADRLPVQPGLPGHLREADRPGLQQTPEAPQFQPSMRIQDHRRPPSAASHRPSSRVPSSRPERINNCPFSSVRGWGRSRALSAVP